MRKTASSLLLVAAYSLLGCLLSAGAVRAEPPRVTLRIASFNVRNGDLDKGEDGWAERAPHLMDQLKFLKADVICLQECLSYQRTDILKAFPTLAAFGESRSSDPDDEQCCILFSPQRFELRTNGTFWLNEGQIKGRPGWDAALPRIVTWACLYDKSAGRAFYVFNTHFDHAGVHARYESALQLVNAVQKEAYANGKPQPAIICGDLNAGEGSESTVLLTALYPDTYRVLHPEGKNVGTFHAFSGAQDGDKIDYILTSHDFELLSAKIDHWSYRDKTHARSVQRWPSDHFPVTAELAYLP